MPLSQKPFGQRYQANADSTRRVVERPGVKSDIVRCFGHFLCKGYKDGASKQSIITYTELMIARLSGTLVSKAPGHAVIDVGGVGYELAVPISTYSRLPGEGADVRLDTFQYVREDVLALYGFYSTDEKELFGQLLGVSGIGPKVALAILSVASVRDIRGAIASGDTAFISSVPGIGTKTAERVVVDLRDKMGVEGAGTDTSGGHDEVVQALVGLGYSSKDSRQAVKSAAAHESETDEVLRRALKELAA